MIISFSITAKLAKEKNKKDPLFEGIKTVTRRAWRDKQFQLITKQWDAGYRRHDAYSKVPYAGGKQIGWLDLTCRPYQEPLIDMPKEDILKEGNLWNSKDEFIKMLALPPDTVVTVVRFQFVPIVNLKKTQNALSGY